MPKMVVTIIIEIRIIVVRDEETVDRTGVRTKLATSGVV